MYERRPKGLVVAAVLLATGALVLPACSGDDDGGSDTTDTTTAEGDNAGETGADSSENDGNAATTVDCDEVLTLAEVEGLFGEPAVLEAPDGLANNEQLGQVTCTWATVEDEESIDDLASQLLQLQYYGGGETMSGKNFYDPEVQYPDAEPLDIGDEGVIDTEGGIDIAFVDGDAAGFLSWTVIDLGGDGQDQTAKTDTMIELARTFHERAF